MKNNELAKMSIADVVLESRAREMENFRRKKKCVSL